MKDPVQSKETVKVTVDLPRDLLAGLEAVRESTGRGLPELMEQALGHFLRGEERTEALYLSAPVDALMKGFYEENTRLEELRSHGDFGLGTFNHLDGEMVMLDGVVYQLKADGTALIVGDEVETPFACVTAFHPTTVEEFEGELEYAGFKNLLDRLIPSENLFYAVRVDGLFSNVKVWSVSKQSPSQPISSVTPSLREFGDIEGTLCGFYTPRFIKSISMAGYHLHFLTADRTRGGHMYQCSLKKARISLQFLRKLELNLPFTIDYLTAHLI